MSSHLFDQRGLLALAMFAGALGSAAASAAERTRVSLYAAAAQFASSALQRFFALVEVLVAGLSLLHWKPEFRCAVFPRFSLAG